MHYHVWRFSIKHWWISRLHSESICVIVRLSAPFEVQIKKVGSRHFNSPKQFITSFLYNSIRNHVVVKVQSFTKEKEISTLQQYWAAWKKMKIRNPKVLFSLYMIQICNRLTFLRIILFCLLWCIGFHRYMLWPYPLLAALILCWLSKNIIWSEYRRDVFYMRFRSVGRETQRSPR